MIGEVMVCPACAHEAVRGTSVEARVAEKLDDASVLELLSDIGDPIPEQAYCAEHGAVEPVREHGELKCAECGSPVTPTPVLVVVDTEQEETHQLYPGRVVDTAPDPGMVCPHCHRPVGPVPTVTEDDRLVESPFLVCKDHGAVYELVGNQWQPA